MASLLKINPLVLKEQIQEAELKGFICLDESHEGLRYYANLILASPISH